MIQQEFPHVADPYQLKVASVRSDNVVTSRTVDGSLPDLGPSLQVPEPTVLAEVADQVYETVIHNYFRHSLAPQAPGLFKVHIKVPKDNGVLETFQGLLQVWQVFKR